MSSPLGLSAGVQRKTKVYIEASNSDCMAPRRAILVSEVEVKGLVVGTGRIDPSDLNKNLMCDRPHSI